MSELRVDHSQWLRRGDNKYIPTDNAKTCTAVDAGVYNLCWAQNTGYYLTQRTRQVDELMLIPSPESEEVMELVLNFWERKAKYVEYGFVFKRGILMYGPPGSGKTSIINLVTDYIINKMNGVVFILQSSQDLEWYGPVVGDIFRSIEPNRPIITIIEDIDGLCEHKNVETMLINLLDGLGQLDNVMYIATTNYTEKLSPRLMNRPNRFDRRIKIGYPRPEAREFYIKTKLKPHDLEKIVLSEWVAETAGLTMAHIGELIKSVVITGNEFHSTLKLLRSMDKKIHSQDYAHEESGGSMGFVAETEEDATSERSRERARERIRKAVSGGKEESVGVVVDHQGNEVSDWIPNVEPENNVAFKEKVTKAIKAIKAVGSKKKKND